MNSSSLLVLGLNPAWQRLFLLDRIQVGGVHRLPAAVEFASGKGINFSRVLHRLGGSGQLIHFLAGKNGERIAQELGMAGISTINVNLLDETRICTTYSSQDGLSTEFIEPSPQIRNSEMEQFLAELNPHWQSFGNIVVCGTAPAGFDWNKLCDLPIEGKKLFLDAWTGIEGWLGTGVELLKVNAEELARLLGMSSDVECIDVHALAKKALQRFKIRNLVVTQGARRVLVFQDEIVLSLCPPRATPFVNAIGAGDSFMAGWIFADVEGLSLKERLARAVAVSVARCEVALPWDFSLDRVINIERECLSRVEEKKWTCSL